MVRGICYIEEPQSKGVEIRRLQIEEERDEMEEINASFGRLCISQDAFDVSQVTILDN